MLRNIKLPTNLGLNIPEIEDITDILPINPVHTWEQLKGKRALSSLTDIVVHHSGVKKEVGMTAVKHAKVHIAGKSIIPEGEPGLPYHMYIRDGRIYQTNDLLDFTYGVRNNNGCTVHICVEGDYRFDTLSEIDRQCLYGAILAVKAVLPNYKRLQGHGEYVATACPSIDMNRVRSDVAALEMHSIYKDSDAGQAATAYTIASRILDLYDKAKGNSQYAAEARRKLLLLEPVCKQLNLL